MTRQRALHVIVDEGASKTLCLIATSAVMRTVVAVGDVIVRLDNDEHPCAACRGAALALLTLGAAAR